MSKQINDGGPAYPGSGVNEHLGMSLRDWFAGHASEKDIENYRVLTNGGMTYSRNREEARYAYADAMLLQRDKDQDDG